MQKKTITKVIKHKLSQWLETISNEDLRAKVKKNLLLSGGSITSMFLKEDVNDYDIYIQCPDVLRSLVNYYAKPHGIEVFDWRNKESLMSEFSFAEDDDNYHSQRCVAIRTIKEGQIKLDCEAGVKIEDDIKEGDYKPLFFSPNAISLSDDIQIVCRFHGTPDQIHETFDFIHATNYFTFNEGLVTNIEALESLISKQLKYQGSMYPLTSVIRSKKFIKRGWNISAGEYLKMSFQISLLDLEDPDVLEEQLIGVDVAYFSTLINILRDVKNKEKFGYEYLKTLIDKVFNEEND